MNSHVNRVRTHFDQERRQGRTVNLTRTERILSLAGGALLVAWALRRRDRIGVAAAVVGGTLAIRGYQGHSGIYDRLGIQRFAGAGGRANVVSGQGVHVDRAITIQAPIDQLYDHWRQFENLPRFMRHLLEVRPAGNNVYRWKARGPMGRIIEWDARVTDERRPHFLTWSSLPGSDIENAGSVHFTEAPAGRGTEVRVVLAYKPPAGALGALVARLLGEEPSRQIREDLGRLKQMIETGEVATSAPRPEGR
jgi:uncharacterized membrane protein